MGKPKGMLESEIRIAMLLLEQRPPRYAGAGRKQCHQGRVRAETPTRQVPADLAIRDDSSVSCPSLGAVLISPGVRTLSTLSDFLFFSHRLVFAFAFEWSLLMLNDKRGSPETGTAC